MIKDIPMMKKWMAENDVKLVKTQILCFRRIAGLRRKGCRLWGLGGCPGWCQKVRFPFADHIQFFKRKNEIGFWVVSHPYEIRDEDLTTMKKIEEEYGLVTEVFEKEKSWYNPGVSSLVLIRRIA